MADYTIGVDLGGTKILAAVINEEGQVIARSKKRTKSEQGALEVIRRIAKCVEEAITESGVERDCVRAAGVCAPGMVNHAEGLVIMAPNLSGWENIPLKSSLEREIRIPVAVDNDVNLGTWGEYVLGSGRGAKVLLGVFVGTGIGGGIVVNGDIFRGANNAAGEVGHMRIIDKGPECGCGLSGHWETLSGRLGIVNALSSELITAGKKGKKDHPLLKKTDGDLGGIRSGDIAEALHAGDKITTKVIQQSCKYMGIGLANLIHAFDPDRIVLGGGVTQALGPNYVYEVIRQTQKYAIPAIFNNVEIQAAELGDDAGILGAALYARKECLGG